ncbi:hypothetical protein BDN72DRAFT_365309 [Pluteus cervinus]|uniref:Uncharacterized protein n=1 Tax=Pluteus cervinus TaxID=181527 RepID=A0ACD3BEP3_9AGAR|nr:hypothetical protein BDN72DRAFT_365309 [Pluteus cervinus]
MLDENPDKSRQKVPKTRRRVGVASRHSGHGDFNKGLPTALVVWTLVVGFSQLPFGTRSKPKTSLGGLVKDDSDDEDEIS